MLIKAQDLRRVFMGAQKKTKTQPKARILPMQRLILGLAALLLCVITAWMGLLGSLRMQDDGDGFRIGFLDRFVAQRLDASNSEMSFSLSPAGMVSGPSFWNPAYLVESLVVFDQDNRALLELSGFKIDMLSALKRRISGNSGSFKISGTNLFITRDPFGNVNLGNMELGDAQDTSGKFRLGETIDDLATEIFHDELQEITLDEVTVFYSDQKTKTANLFVDGELTLRLDDDGFSLSAGLREDIREGGDSWVRLNLTRALGSEATDVNFTFERVDTQLIAKQFEPFSFLESVEARLSASFVAQLGQELTAVDIAGVVDLGEGRLKATETNPSASFKSVKAYFDYRAEAQTFRFSSIEMETSLGSLQASGSAELVFDEISLDRAIVDVVLDHITFPHGEQFASDVTFDGGTFKGEVKFKPIVFAVNEASLILGNSLIELTGGITSSKGNWNSIFTAAIDRIEVASLIDVWPKNLVPKTKNWMDTNITSGAVHDLDVSFSRIDGKSDTDLTFEYSGTTAHVLKTAPMLENASGHARLTDNAFKIWIERGGFKTPYGKIDGAGSLFTIVDVRKKPSDGRVDLKVSGPLRAGLEFLDIEKFKFIEKMGKSTDMATGRFEGQGVVEFPMIKDPPKGVVKFDVAAAIKNFKSTQLIEGQEITSDEILATADNDSLRIDGPMEINGAIGKAKFQQKLQNNPNGEYQIEVDVALSEESLAKFGFQLPEQAFKGTALATIQANGHRGEDTSFKLLSNLEGAEVRIPILGWRKSADKETNLEVAGSFGNIVQIDRLLVEGAGLIAEGSMSLQESGALKLASFETVKVGNWFDAAVEIDAEANQTRITGNRLDIRRLNIGRAKRDKSGSIVANLRQLRITDDLALNQFKGNLGSGRSTSGNFTASINGAAPIQGKLYPHSGRTRIEVFGNDAGQVLSAANLLDSVRGGEISLILDTTEEEDVYFASFQAKQFRVLHTNALAALMDNLSLVGLLQKLSGDGIHFEQARGQVLLKPSGAILKDVSITGASMGMTLNGDYYSENKALDFDGVLTPLYFVNGTPERAIGREFGTKKGSGLISMAYEIEGTSDEPKVKAKPLSILFPGPFKNLFKSKKKKTTE